MNAHAPAADTETAHGSPTHVPPYRNPLATSTLYTHVRSDSETALASPTAVDSNSSGSGPLNKKIAAVNGVKQKQSPTAADQPWEGQRDKDGFAVPSLPSWEERERRSSSDEHLRLNANGANGINGANGVNGLNGIGANGMNGYGGEREYEIGRAHV